MESEIVTKRSKRLRLSTDQEDENMDLGSEGKSEPSNETSVDQATTSEATNVVNQNQGANENKESSKDSKGEDVVVISSDDDSEKGAAKPTADAEPMETTSEEETKKEQDPKQDEPTDEVKAHIAEDKVPEKEEPPKVESAAQKEETNVETTKDVLKEKVTESKQPAAKADSDSDECISQEDLLAQLGLSSVRAKSSKKDERLPNGIPGNQRPLIHHKPKESIVDLLRAPKLKSNAEPPKKKINGDAAIVVNGVNSDDSAPGTPEMVEGAADEEDYELQAKEQLIEELRQELRNEEAKLMLLKKLQAAQNDTSKSGSKYQKEKENEKLLSSMQFATKLPSQLALKKGQGLPPPPPLKTHVTTAGTYQPPVAIQPKLLPKLGGQQLHTSGSLMSSKASSVQMVKGGTASARSGTSAIKDLQNVISSMSTNLIHPTPLYLRTSSQPASIYSTTTQPSPLRPTPVRVNTATGAGSSSSGYSSFPVHGSAGTTKSHSPALTTAGKQAAAKMALRKQLEKTLLQIPPPKPPPPEWSFIPSLNSTEFMTLVGFQMVVDVLATKKEGKSEGKSSVLSEKVKVPENPKVCGQCGTDFTPGWRKKPHTSSEVMMCEKCSTVNVKKELKTEHTTRLKAAFLKALKQEQEIEQKMSETTPIAPKPQSQKGSSHSSTSSSGHHHHVSHGQGVLHHHHQRIQPGLYHHHGQQQQQHTDSLLFQLQQQHLQQQQQEMEVACRQADIRWHPYLSTQQHHHTTSSSHKPPQHHHSYVSDSDRQYLLDMIPSLPAQTLGYSSGRI